MQRLVDDLLTLSALESEQNPPADATFAIAPLLLESAADAKALSGGQHTIALDSIRDSAATVRRQPRRARERIRQPRFSNAVRYTPEGGTITLSWRIDDDGSGEFGVADTGIGIAAETSPRLTERFYRVDRSRSRATGGTGLGLAIVKHVLLRHQAELASRASRAGAARSRRSAGARACSASRAAAAEATPQAAATSS